MTFINRNELPEALKAAYDIAAKGKKDDTSRTNEKKKCFKWILKINSILTLMEHIH